MNIQEACKNGKKIRRSSWLDGIYLFISGPADVYAKIVYSANADGKDPYVEWIPHHTDLIADDWEISQAQ